MRMPIFKFSEMFNFFYVILFVTLLVFFWRVHLIKLFFFFFSPSSSIAVVYVIYIFKSYVLVLIVFAGPTILFFQENAGSILIVRIALLI